MPQYLIDVVEIRHVSCQYTVEADNPDRAIAKAMIGDTVEEVESNGGEVNDRVVQNLASELTPLDEQDDGETNENDTARAGIYTPYPGELDDGRSEGPTDFGIC